MELEEQEQKELDYVSLTAPSQAYKGLGKQKKRRQRETASLPRHILDNK